MPNERFNDMENEETKLQLVNSETEKKMLLDLQNDGVRSFLRTGDLSDMPDKVKDYVLVKMCTHFGLDPILRPFQLIELKGKAVWYTTKAATDQVAAIRSLTRRFSEVSIDSDRGIAMMTAYVTDGHREESAIAAVPIMKFGPPTVRGGEPIKLPLTGEEYANALMKLQTKALRRATMAFVGMVDFGGDDDDPATARLRLREQIESAKEITKGDSIADVDQPQRRRRGRPPKGDVAVSTQSEAPPIHQVVHTPEVEAKKEDPLDMAMSAAKAAQPPIDTEITKPTEEIYSRENTEHKQELAQILINDIGLDFSNPEQAKLAGMVSQEADGKLVIKTDGKLHKPNIKKWIENKIADIKARNQSVL